MKPSRQHDNHDSLAMLPWYPRDWRASTGRALMSTLARGIYRELLDAAWLDGGSLPGDDRTLMALAGCSPREWASSRQEVLARFETGDDGRLRQPRLTWQFARASDLRERQRKAAETANEAKRIRAAQRNGERGGNGNGVGNGDRDSERTPPSPTPTPTPTPTPERGVEGNPSREAREPQQPPTPTPRGQEQPGEEAMEFGEVRELRATASALLDRLQALGLDRDSALREASSMPAKGKHRARHATRLEQLSGRWLAVTVDRLEQRLADAAEHAAVVGQGPEEPDPPVEHPQARECWERVRAEAVAAGMSAQSDASWLRPVVAVDLQRGGAAGAWRVVLVAPSDQHREWISGALRERVTEAASALGIGLELRRHASGPGEVLA